jgi:DNA invertase Pin-like site-specific DNA recombinase
MTRAAIYARVSTDEQDPLVQVEQLRALCQARGWDIAPDAEYVDVLSGADPARLRFNQMQHDARVGKFRVIVFWAWDRVTRGGIEDVLSIAKQWSSWGVAWESLREPFLSSAADPSTAKLLLSIFAWIAERERERIRERTKDGLQRARNLGRHLGRPRGAKDKRPRKRRQQRAPFPTLAHPDVGTNDPFYRERSEKHDEAREDVVPRAPSRVGDDRTSTSSSKRASARARHEARERVGGDS